MFVYIHMAMFIFNDILLIALKKASDKYSSSKCRSSCCEGLCNCMNYVEQKSKESRERRKKALTLESLESNER